MKAKKIVLLLGLGLPLAGMAAGIWYAAERPVDDAAAQVPMPVASKPALSPAAAANPGLRPASAVAALPPAVVQPVRGSVPVPASIDQSAPAEISMAEARVNGDHRAPPITRVPETDQPPSAQELADPKLYAQYEKRQASRGYASYVQAVDANLPVQEQALADAKAQGMPPEMQAVAEQKIRLMQQMRDQLVAEHPEIAN